MFTKITLTKEVQYIIVIGGALGLIGASIAYATFFLFSGTSGTAHVLGQFFSDGTGNAGLVQFNQTAGLDGNTLTGTFWVETIGTVTFNSDARINPPLSGKATDLWSVSGTAYGNAGTIDLTGVQYDPVSRTLIGYGMNNGIGRVPFGAAGSIPTSISGSTISMGFEGRVKVLGNIGGNSAFDTFYSAGVKFNASVLNTTLNKIRKNVALLSRNISNTQMNSAFTTSNSLNNKIFFINNSNTLRTLRYDDVDGSFPTATVDSMIIVGGDLILDKDVINSPNTRPKGIIVLKNDKGLGGNIIVTDTVKKIESSIFAEGTLYSGTGITNLYNDSTSKITTLSENQLYIKGSLMSRNTIGGATQSGAIAGNGVCVYDQTSCTYEEAIKYDLNYFRLTPPTRTTTQSYNHDYDNYAVIIERDPRMGSNPPPGFETK